MPAVGDWVVVCDAPGDRFAIEALLPRRTKVSRKTPWLKAEEHILVANVDTVLLVNGLDEDFNPRRLERYLTAAWDSGADPVIVLTKLDVCDDPGKLVEAESVAVGVPVYAVSNVTGEGIDAIRALLQPARTFVLLGSSGTGKSTLVNRLAGKTVMDTGELRNETGPTHDSTPALLVMPGGAIRSTRRACEPQVREGDYSAFRTSRSSRPVPLQRLRTLSESDCAVREAPKRASSTRVAGELRSSSASCAPDRARSSHRIQRELKSLARARARDPAGEEVRGEALSVITRARADARGRTDRQHARGRSRVTTEPAPTTVRR
jgi:ribosome biogenesis GTPase